MNATSQSGLWPVVLAVGLLVCGGARGLAADTAAGRPSGQQLQSLRDWVATYFQMREFMPSSRNDPNLPAVTNILEEAVKRRGSFVEGRVLLAACSIYASRFKDAHTQAEEASKFLDQRGLNPTPFGLDCCAVWLRMGRPDDVQGFIDVLKNEKIIPANKLTAFQALLVAVHSWQTF